ncbi:NADPH-dependent oxidoreductase [Actinomyces bowdenii]|uniref:NADPH-dependent oxidoreductase n=1 Tax=Actinomyces bowdenii TaxID=131109 RepID=UPI001ABD05FE|nr:NADPH-dependent oxidoreductase [Actinomyces bowdenii]MBO3723447.1 NADPH-dependent oxidoreductase [Actinomyces bowdenii]
MTDAATDAAPGPLRAPQTTPLTNETIATLMAHRTIRAFTDEPLDEATMTTVLDAARHAATSSFLQQTTIIRVTDPAVREAVHGASGQPYVGGTRGELLLCVVDLHRNAVIRQRAGADLEPLERMSVFLQAVEDTLIAAQSMVVAAESLGLGTVYLGSIQGDAPAVIRALDLPERTFPLLGLIVGHPDQDPQYKPRLPRGITTGLNTYPRLEAHEQALADYDRLVQDYYDLRDAGARLDSFTRIIATKLGVGAAATAPTLEILHAQRLALH